MLEIRKLEPADIPAALRLSTQAGWNQLEADWQRLLTLWPQGCLAGWDDGRLVSTATIAAYGRQLAWVGMVLVDESCRGRGMGTTMFDACLVYADQMGIQRLALDASDMGRPLYLKKGFADCCPIDRWIRHPGQVEAPADHAPRRITWGQSAAWENQIMDFDRQASGVDRARLLRQLASEPHASLRITIENDVVTGFGLSRRGRTAGMIGPVAAASVQAATNIVTALLHDRVADQPDHAVYIDVTRPNRLTRILEQYGFAVQRTLTRMGRPCGSRDELLAGQRVFAGAGFEMG